MNMLRGPRNNAFLRPRLRNRGWEQYGGIGMSLGALILLFGVSLVVMEICRAAEGVTNRGDGTTRDTQNFYIYALSNLGYYPVPPGGLVDGVQPNFYWDWNMPGTFFGTIFVAAGIAGILSSMMKTYTSIFTFWTFALVGALESIFLMATFSISIRGLVDAGENDSANRLGPSDDAEWILTIFVLVWSIVLFLLCVAALSAVAGALGFGNTKSSVAPTLQAVNRTGFYGRRLPFMSRPF